MEEMTLKEVGIGIGIVMVLLLGGAYLKNREDLIKAQAQVQASEQAIKLINEHDAQAKTQLDSALKQIQAQQDAMNKQFTSAQSPQQIAALVQQLMGLKQPIIITTPAATPSNPNPTPVATVPVEDAPQVKAYVQQCEQCKLDLKAKVDELTYAQTHETALQGTIDQKQKEINTLNTAAKGGSWIKRAGKAALYIGIGGAIGYAAHR